KRVMERAAQTLTPVSLELGGKDPMIVLGDADIERAANAAAYYSMQNAGQTCISIERVYVEEGVYDQFVAKVTEKVRALRQRDPSSPARSSSTTRCSTTRPSSCRWAAGRPAAWARATAPAASASTAASSRSC